MKFFKLVGILCVFSAFSCSPKYYSPNTQQVTLFEEEGDININVMADATKFEGQAAYAFSDQYAAAVNFTRFIPVEEDAGSGSGYLFEIAPGYYRSVGDNMIFEIYGQVGFGKFENEFKNLLDTIPSTGAIMGNAFRIGLQPSLAYKQDRFALALSSRVASLNFVNVEGDLFYSGIDQVQLVEQNKNNFLIEPALTFWFGLEQFKLQFQYALSLNLSNNAIPRDKQLFSIGINADLNRYGF